MAMRAADVKHEMHEDETWNVYPAFCDWWGLGQSRQAVVDFIGDLQDAVNGLPHRESHLRAELERLRFNGNEGWEQAWREAGPADAVAILVDAANADTSTRTQLRNAESDNAILLAKGKPWMDNALLSPDVNAAAKERVSYRQMWEKAWEAGLRKAVYELPSEQVPNEPLILRLLEWGERWGQGLTEMYRCWQRLKQRHDEGEPPVLVPRTDMAPDSPAQAPPPAAKRRLCALCPNVFNPVADGQEVCDGNHDGKDDNGNGMKPETMRACMAAWKKARREAGRYVGLDRVRACVDPEAGLKRTTIHRWMKAYRAALDAFEDMDADQRNALLHG